jgi:hypothetical protein
MAIKLENAGQKKIAVIKEIRSAYGFDLKTSKQWMDMAPVVLPDLNPAMTQALAMKLRECGARVFTDPGPLDRLTALGCIHTAEEALGNGEIDEARANLRNALTLIGDM